MGILSGLKQLNDARKERNETKSIERREERLKKIDEFIRTDYSDSERILGAIGDTGIFDLDRTAKATAPYLTTMLEEIYLNQQKNAQMHELEGRYAELKERYDELKKEYDTLIAKLAKNMLHTR